MTHGSSRRRLGRHGTANPIQGRRLLLTLVTAAVALAVTAVAVEVLHQVTLRVRRDALVERVASAAALVEAITERTRDPAAALEILRRAQDDAPTLGRTGELVIARRDGGSMVFVFHSARQTREGLSLSLPEKGRLGEPMQAALAGETGWTIGRDYDGTKVLGAHRLLPRQGWGVVSKMDMTEVRQPFWWALAVVVPVALLLTAGGVVLFLRLSEPLIREMEASEVRFRSMVQHGNDVISLLAADGTILYESPAVERILGYPPEELEGRAVLDLVHPEDADEVQEALASLAMQPSEAMRAEVRFRHADGSYRWLEAVGSNLLHEEAVGGIVVNSRDVTEQRRVRRELELRTRELSERVKELDCLLDVTRLLAESDLTVPKLARRVAAVLPPGWQHPEITEARLEIEGESFATPGFAETPWCMQAVVPGADGPLGTLQVCYTEERPEAFEGPFLAEERELLEAVAQRVGEAVEHLWAEEALAESEERYRTLFTQVPVGLYRTTPEGRFLDANPALAEILGHPDVASLATTPLSEVYADPADRERWRAELAATGEVRGFEVEIRRPDGSAGWVRHSGRAVTGEGGSVVAYEGAAEDITARKQAEEALHRSEAFLRQSQRVGRLGGWEYDVPSGRVTWTEETYRLHGVTPEEYDPSEPEHDIQFFAPGDREILAELFGRAVAEGEPYDVELQLEPATGGRIWVHVVGEAERRDGEVVRVYGTIADITERRRAQEALLRSRASLAEAQRIAHLGSWQWDVATGELSWSDEVFRIFGFAPGQVEPTYEEFLERVHPDDRPLVSSEIEAALDSGSPYSCLHRVVRPDGDVRWVHEQGEVRCGPDGRAASMVGVVHDVTARTVAEEELEAALAELQRSNAELQQFAYVASHDLQEPLRMVVSYLQLLERSIGETLDERTRRFMDYAVDGGQRMQKLIHDLLAFSRVQTHGHDFEAVDLEQVMGATMRNLEGVLQETGGQVRWDGLPAVDGDPGQLVQLLQNLVGNALKFHGDEPPRVEVSAASTPEGVRLSVADNGIGIPPEHSERVFEVFQRLHGRAAYPGTGIGLAICKRIVERHGGRIWVESTPGAGSTFHLILPEHTESDHVQ